MTEDVTVDRFRCRDEPARRATVGIAGTCVAAWMVVREDIPALPNPPASAMIVRNGKAVSVSLPTCPDRRRQRACSSACATDRLFAARIGISQAPGEELTRSGEAVELEREFGTLIAHP